MKEFKRKYHCRAANKDTIVVSFEDDGEDTIRIGCNQGRRKESFSYLNSEQIGNLIELLTEWRSEIPVEDEGQLWADIS